MPDPAAAVNRFYAGLAALKSDDWLRVAVSPPIDDYQVASEPGITAISGFAEGSADPVVTALLQQIRQEAGEIAAGFIPSLEVLRVAMRPSARPGASELTPDGYQILMSEAARRVFVVASGIALVEHLPSPTLAGLYQPFEGFLPLSAVLDPQPDFVRDLALALLTCTRWAVEKGPGSLEEKTAYWETVFPKWMYAFNGGEMAGIGVPNLGISMALTTAGIAALPEGGGKDIRYEAERRIQVESDERIEELLGERRRITRRHLRRWIVSRIVRVMEAMLTREAPDGTKAVEPPPASLALIDRTLKAMGFEAADREPPAPSGGVLILPKAFTWWSPTPIHFETNAGSTDTASGRNPGNDVTPPEAHGRNLALMMEPDHFNPALEWYTANVLPFIDDYATGPEGSEDPEIGLSRFVAAIPYAKQLETVHLFLWALADGLLVAAQTREANGGNAASFRRNRLSLIRAIWSEEVDAATSKALGITEANPRPDLGDPKFNASAVKWGDTRERIESGMRRFLKLPVTEGNAASDDLSSFQIVAAARAAGYLGSGAAGTRRGCATTALPLLGLAVAIIVAIRGLDGG